MSLRLVLLQAGSQSEALDTATRPRVPDNGMQPTASHQSSADPAGQQSSTGVKPLGADDHQPTVFAAQPQDSKADRDIASTMHNIFQDISIDIDMAATAPNVAQGVSVDQAMPEAAASPGQDMGSIVQAAVGHQQSYDVPADAAAQLCDIAAAAPGIAAAGLSNSDHDPHQGIFFGQA